MAKFNLFNSIKLTRPKANVFDLSHDVKMSLDMGQLVPIMVQECIPGDRYTIGCESLLRFAPMVAPVMHRMDVSMHYFFVPNRILWDGWEKWITGDEDYVHPTVQYNSTVYGANPLIDYLGLPSTTGTQTVSALPFAAYQAIYDQYYRDQNLIAEVPYALVTGDNSSNADLFKLRRRAWTHDYFTAALPFAQKGPAVDIPLGNVTIDPDYDPTTFEQLPKFRTVLSGAPAPGRVTGFDPDGGEDYQMVMETTGASAMYDPGESLVSGSTSINDLRRATRLQEWLERNARAGTRYIESILGHFGVRSSDSRLQRPEYITGTKSPVIISEVLNTTGEADGLPQGNMAGHGVSVTSGKYGNYRCEEHGFIIGVMSVMPLPAYQQGIPKHFLRDDRFDYFWPEFANIGEQEVLNKELYVDHSTPNGVFGYVPRYSEYKYTPSRVAGDFKTSLSFWHFGRIFEDAPNLNQTFVECDPGKRIFAVEDPDVNSLYCQVLNKVRAVRLMPKFGTPTF